MDLINNTDLKFVDISSELWRRYVFRDYELVINNPQWLNVSSSGGHRILDGQGICHYVKPDWLHLSWRVEPGQPHFVK